MKIMLNYDSQDEKLNGKKYYDEFKARWQCRCFDIAVKRTPE